MINSSNCNWAHLEDIFIILKALKKHSKQKSNCRMLKKSLSQTGYFFKYQFLTALSDFVRNNASNVLAISLSLIFQRKKNQL